MLIRLRFSSVEEDIRDLLVILATLFFFFFCVRDLQILHFCGLGNWRKELRCVVALGDIYSR